MHHSGHILLTSYSYSPSYQSFNTSGPQQVREHYYGTERTDQMPPCTPLFYDQWSPATRACLKCPKESVNSGPHDQSTPDPLSLRADPEASPAILEEMRQIREDNQRLQLTMMEMQHVAAQGCVLRLHHHCSSSSPS